MKKWLLLITLKERKKRKHDFQLLYAKIGKIIRMNPGDPKITNFKSWRNNFFTSSAIHWYGIPGSKAFWVEFSKFKSPKNSWRNFRWWVGTWLEIFFLFIFPVDLFEVFPSLENLKTSSELVQVSKSRLREVLNTGFEFYQIHESRILMYFRIHVLQPDSKFFSTFENSEVQIQKISRFFFSTFRFSFIIVPVFSFFVHSKLFR